MNLFEVLFVRPWPFWAAGISIGVFVTVFAWITGKALGISSGYTEMCTLGRGAGTDRWKLYFVLGLPLGGLAASVLSSVTRSDGAVSLGWSVQLSLMDRTLGFGRTTELCLLAIGGVLIGFGARVAGGCTSGHSIVGVALGAKSSIVATIGFLVGGFATTQLLFRVIGAAT